VFSLSLAIGLAAVNTFYRDIQTLLGHVLRLWFYASPGLWSFQDHLQEPSPLRTILMLNPMAPILESYRNIIYGTADAVHAPPDWTGLLWALGVSVVLLVGAVALLNRLEPTIAKVV
jgi:ABC-type polysaccharide/polyol phosphate export permease